MMTSLTNLWGGLVLMKCVVVHCLTYLLIDSIEAEHLTEKKSQLIEKLMFIWCEKQNSFASESYRMFCGKVARTYSFIINDVASSYIIIIICNTFTAISTNKYIVYLIWKRTTATTTTTTTIDTAIAQGYAHDAFWYFCIQFCVFFFACLL